MQKSNGFRAQDLINISALPPIRSGEDGSCCIETNDGWTLVYMIIQPYNVSVLGNGDIIERIHALKNVLEITADLEFLCLCSAQSYEDNKRYYRKRADDTSNPIVRQLLLEDAGNLDDINVSMATSREFVLGLRIRTSAPKEEKQHQVARSIQTIKEQRFIAHVTNSRELRRIFAIYFAQDVFTENFPDFDGAQYMEEEAHV